MLENKNLDFYLALIILQNIEIDVWLQWITFCALFSSRGLTADSYRTAT